MRSVMCMCADACSCVPCASECVTWARASGRCDRFHLCFCCHRCRCRCRWRRRAGRAATPPSCFSSKNRTRVFLSRPRRASCHVVMQRLPTRRQPPLLLYGKRGVVPRPCTLPARSLRPACSACLYIWRLSSLGQTLCLAPLHAHVRPSARPLSMSHPVVSSLTCSYRHTADFPATQAAACAGEEPDCLRRRQAVSLSAGG